MNFEIAELASILYLYTNSIVLYQRAFFKKMRYPVILDRVGVRWRRRTTWGDARSVWGRVRMGTQAGSVKREGDGAGRRGAKIVAAVRVMSIDYRPIVDKAVAGLARNTPDARREVYAQAREVVKRHLQLMRLPEPLVELEKLALDLTIRKIERQWRLDQAADVVIHTTPAKPATPRPMTVAQALATLGVTCRVFARVLAALFGALGMRPVGIWLAAAMKPLWWLSRGLFSPVGLRRHASDHGDCGLHRALR